MSRWLPGTAAGQLATARAGRLADRRLRRRAGRRGQQHLRVRDRAPGPRAPPAPRRGAVALCSAVSWLRELTPRPRWPALTGSATRPYPGSGMRSVSERMPPADAPRSAPSSPSAGPRPSSGDGACCGPSWRQPAAPTPGSPWCRAPRRSDRRWSRSIRPSSARWARRGGDRAPAGEPGRRARTPTWSSSSARSARLHDRRQPAQAELVHHRHAVRRRHPRGLRTRRRGRRHVRRGEHPGRSHDRVRLRRLDPEAADEPALGRVRADPGRGHRPALRAAQPIRPAAVPGGPVAVAAGHGGRRGHGRGGSRGQPARGGRPGGGDHRRRPAPDLQRLRRAPHRAAAGVRTRSCTCCRRAAQFDLDIAHAGRTSDAGARPRGGWRSGPRRPTCASWPATSPPRACPRPITLGTSGGADDRGRCSVRASG